MAFEFLFPDVGEGIHEGEIVRWRVKIGDVVKEDDILCEMETAKAIVEIPTPKNGTVLFLSGKEGDVIKVGEVLAVIGAKGEAWKKKEAPKAPESAPGVVGSFSSDVAITLPPRGSFPVIPPASETNGPIDRIPLKGIRKAIASHMSESWRTIPHVTHMDEFDASVLVAKRNSEKADAGKKGIKLTYLAYIVKVIIDTLKLHPRLNAAMDERNSEIIFKKFYNIGIAVDTPDGLMVPVIKNADSLSTFEIAQKIFDLATRVRDRKIKQDELSGATFTVTNIGSLGGTYATPIIQQGTSAILGTMQMREKPVVIAGKVEIRPMMTLVLSFDHRIVDGADAARFMNALIEKLSIGGPDGI